MVLCAGYGTRLRPLSDELPKPLVPFGDRTLLEHVLDGLLPAFLPAVVNAHHLADVFAERAKTDDRIAEVVVESEIRGTAGGVAGARAHLGPAPVIITNGDVLARVDWAALVARTPPSGVCLAVAPRAAGEGTVGLGERAEVVRLRGERFGAELSSGDYVGTMALGEEALAGLPDAGCLIGDLTLPLLRRGAPVSTLVVAGRWFAPGDGVAEYLDEHRAWLEERAAVSPVSSRPRATPVPPPALASYVGPGATIPKGVDLAGCVLGAGVTVTGVGLLRRVVAWPGARVSAPLEDAVVTTRGTVVRRPIA